MCRYGRVQTAAQQMTITGILGSRRYRSDLVVSVGLVVTRGQWVAAPVGLIASGGVNSVSRMMVSGHLCG
jgi:hypothetical protein